MLAPIVLFVYNRPWHTQQTVEALQKCELAAESDLYIFADGPKADATEETRQKITEVRHYLQTIDGFKSVQIDEASLNIGCADSIIRGINIVIEKYGKVIVVEDDIVAHPFFLRFMNDALDTYKDDKKIFCISATMEKFAIPSDYKCDVFLTHRTGSWGWATWNNRWQMINWNIDSYQIIQHPTQRLIKQFNRGGEDLYRMLILQLKRVTDAWDIRYCYNMSVLNQLCLRPVKSFVSNIGMDSSGTHCGDAEMPLLPLYNKNQYSINLPSKISIDRRITKNIQSIFHQERNQRVGAVKWLKRKVRKIMLQNNYVSPFHSIVFNLALIRYYYDTKNSRRIKKLYNRLLNGQSKDASVLTRFYGKPFFCPFLHKLLFYQKEFPLYDKQLPKLCHWMQKKIARKLNIIDVGANIGDTVRSIGIKDAFYLCVEGDMSFSKYIKRNLKGYDYAIENVFLNDKDNSSSYIIESSNGTGHLKRLEGNGDNINLLTLDELLETKYPDIRIDLLKIDTDGFDFKVIRGAKKCLIKWKPLLFFEWDKAFCKEQSEDPLSIFPILDELGYKECILFDNFGNLFNHVDTSNVSLLESYIDNTIGDGLPYYYDVLAIPNNVEYMTKEILSIF